MENAVDALKIAFGVIVFVIALSLFFFMTNQAKATSDLVLYMSDKTNFYDMEQSDAGKVERKVGIDTIIPNIYRYASENIGITILLKDGKFIRYSTSDDSNYGKIGPAMTAEEKQKNPYVYEDFVDYKERYLKEKLYLTDDDIDDNFYSDQHIFVGGNAIWNGTPEDRAKRVAADITGKQQNINNNNEYKGLNTYLDGKSFIERCTNSTFYESFIEIVTDSKQIGNIDINKKRSVIEIIYREL